jgi:hypothetical protein
MQIIGNSAAHFDEFDALVVEFIRKVRGKIAAMSAL